MQCVYWGKGRWQFYPVTWHIVSRGRVPCNVSHWIIPGTVS